MIISVTKLCGFAPWRGTRNPVGESRGGVAYQEAKVLKFEAK